MKIFDFMKDNFDRLGPQERPRKTSLIGCTATILLVLGILVYFSVVLSTFSPNTPIISSSYPQAPSDAVLILNSTNFGVNMYNSNFQDVTSQAIIYLSVSNASGTTNYSMVPLFTPYTRFTYTVNGSIFITSNSTVSFNVLNTFTCGLYTYYVCLSIISNFTIDQITGQVQSSYTDSSKNCISLVNSQYAVYSFPLAQQTFAIESGNFFTTTQTASRVMTLDKIRWTYCNSTANYPCVRTKAQILLVNLKLAQNFQTTQITFNNYVSLFSNFGGLWHLFMEIASLIFCIGWLMVPSINTLLDKCDRKANRVTPLPISEKDDGKTKNK